MFGGVLMKLCSRCGDYKDLDEYNKHPSTYDKLQPICKVCDRDKSREWYQKNKKIAQERRKKWQDENHDLHLKHVNDYYKRKREKKDVATA